MQPFRRLLAITVLALVGSGPAISQPAAAAPADTAVVVNPTGIVTKTVTPPNFLATFTVETTEPVEIWIRALVGGKPVPAEAKQCALDGSQCVNIQGSEIVTRLPASRKLVLRVDSRRKDQPLTVQFIGNHRHVAWFDLVVGEPAQDAPAEARDLTRYGVAEWQLSSSWWGARRAFLQVPRSFVVFSTRGFPARTQDGSLPRTVAAGEPLLQVGSVLMRTNGELVIEHVPGPEGAVGLFTATAPAAIVMPPPRAEESTRSEVSFYHSPYGDDVAELTGIEDPKVDAFLAAREPVKACIGRELEKSGSGLGYDVATYNQDGSIIKVQSLTSVIENRIYQRCKVRALDAKRAVLRKSLRVRALADVKAHLGS